jgi:hypothetical protein
MPRRRVTQAAALALIVGLGGGLAGRSEGAGFLNRADPGIAAGANVTTAYFFRGIRQARRGLIAQPWAEAGLQIYEGDGAISSLTLLGGVWTSFQSEHAPGSEHPRAFYELDVYGGATVGLGQYLELGASYVAYVSPADAFEPVQEVDFSLALDDAEMLGALALNPWVLGAFEAAGSRLGPDRGTYVELGVEPGFELPALPDHPLGVSFPLTIGLGLGGYYQRPSGGGDETFGYVSGGVTGSVPLAFLPDALGAWSATAGVQILGLGGVTRAANGGENPWVVGTWGLALAY